MITREDLGEYFIKDGEIYYCNAYTDKPTANLKNIRTGQDLSIVYDSPIAEKFNKLFEVQARNGVYHLNEAMPVEKINLNNKEGE